MGPVTHTPTCLRRSLTTLFACLALASGTRAFEVHVSSGGDDRGPGSAERPFASLARARDALREHKQREGLREPLTITVQGGTYTLEAPLVFTAEDSGTEACPVTLRARPGDTVLIRGSRPVRDWARNPDGTWSAALAEQGWPSFRFHQLFAAGGRLVLARHPNRDPEHPNTGGLLYVDAAGYRERQTFHYAAGELPFEAWRDTAQAEVSIYPYHCWDHNLIPVRAVDPVSREIVLRYPVTGRIYEGNRYFVQNLPGALDAPGEWYADVRTGRLSLLPPPGQTDPGEVLAPLLEDLLVLSGTPAEPVRWLHVQGFHLAYAEQDGIALEGAANCRITGNRVRCVGGVGINVGFLRNALTGVGNPWKQAGLSRVRLHSGDRSLLFSHPCTAIRVAGNDITDCGGDGIVLRGDGSTADNNHVSLTGAYDRVCAGVTVCGNDNLVVHNDIHDVPRDGIFINGARNTAEFNTIRYSMLDTADNSAIALRQHNVAQAVRDRGNVLRFNRILDTVGYGSRPHCTHPPQGLCGPLRQLGHLPRRVHQRRDRLRKHHCALRRQQPLHPVRRRQPGGEQCLRGDPRVPGAVRCRGVLRVFHARRPRWQLSGTAQRAAT